MPEPAHRIGENSGRLFSFVRSRSPCMIHFVPGVNKGAFHRLVRHPPIAAVLVIIVTAILQKNADGFRFCLPDKRGVDIASSQTYVSPDAGKNPTECIRAFPRSSEGANGAAACSTYSPVTGLRRKPKPPPVRSRFFYTSGNSSSNRKRAYASPRPSYS